MTSGVEARDGADGDAAARRVERELSRVLTRLASLGPDRLCRPGPFGATPVDLVRPVLQQLADAAAALEGRPPRRVPALAERATADQLAVLGRDLLTADVHPEAPDGARAAALAVATDRLTVLRRAL